VNTPAAGAVARPDGLALARRAAAAVTARLAGRAFDGRLPAAAGLRSVGATFVTLEAGGELLGCIGTLDPARPLFLDAMRNAVRAAADPRLPAVAAAQWPCVDVTVSVLSAGEPLAAASLPELIALLRPGVDGLVLADGYRRATFLPSVWHKVGDAEQFVGALLRKGGWSGGRTHSPAAPDGWPEGLSALRYTTTEFTDPAPRPPADARWENTAGHAADGGPLMRQDDPHG
jgi:AmmeMemoRadiSam system protein A